ncbi:hypothetical protein I3842_09G132400 [Carya illinoinensis]|uniref:CCHC-type domain-containing protein n=1 Tax=Carya illinoinensis TaxID=32201 RepID=A0A922E440_CARIL|nr:hypothetical protein I3842_09G132400 [Carya illinoinensis]
MSPMPPLDKAFSLVLQEERQRQARVAILPAAESCALAASHHQTRKRDKFDITCYNCGKTGHTKDKCYRLIGFPPDFKFTKTKQGNNHLANQTTSQPSNGNAAEPAQLALSQTQIQQLMLLANSQTSQLSIEDSGKGKNASQPDPATHGSHMAVSHSGPSYMDSDWSC